MITKDQFVYYINEIKTLTEQANMLDEALKSFDSCRDFGGFSNFRAVDALVSLLEDAMGEERNKDYPTDISYFIYDLEFGALWTEDSFQESDGTPIDISTPEKLYDYIIRSKNSD